MSSPLNSSSQNQIRAVDNALGQYIRQAESGNLNKGTLTNIQQQLTKLAKDPNIPDAVRQNLQVALNELKAAQTGNLNNLYNAKMQVDQVLGGKEAEGGTGAGEEKLGGGSLGSEEH